MAWVGMHTRRRMTKNNEGTFMGIRERTLGTRLARVVEKISGIIKERGVKV